MPYCHNEIDWLDKKISKEISELNQICEQIWQIFSSIHQTSLQYTFFSAACGTFSEIENLLSQEHAYLNAKELK